MKIEQANWDLASGWTNRGRALPGSEVTFVLVFGGRAALEKAERFHELRARYPRAELLLASTSGNIAGIEISDTGLVATAVIMEKTRIACAAHNVTDPSESRQLGADLARQLNSPGLVHILVLSDGGITNGAELARGINSVLPPDVLVTGGLAGDGTKFERTLVGLNEPPVPGRVVALAFYGTQFRSTFGSAGGWKPFGPDRIVTRSDGNRLFELDGSSALNLYKQYLGDQAAGLPGTALRFPLSVTPADGSPAVVRTILSIDEAAGSMTFAGDIPPGARVRFMHASYEDLLDGATQAAEQTHALDCDLAVCVSCVGRRIVLGQRTEEEIELVRESVGPRAVITGFYSYGELAPAEAATNCRLHNQTMTVTAFTEE